MRFFSWRVAATAIGVLLCVLALDCSIGAQDARNISGFAPTRARAEREWERKLQEIVTARQAEENLRRLTSEPHMAGTEASHRVALWLLDRYRSFGFDAQIVSYTVWLPQPRIVQLEMTRPSRRVLATPEPPIPGDPQTFDKRAVMAFNAYSPSGEITAPVVYANYGMLADYRELARRGVQVTGKIVIARYGLGYRGIKAKLAEEHHAVGLILYSDPQDDGYAAGDVYPRGPWRPMGGIQRGAVQYTQIYPGDPLTPGVASTPGVKRLAPQDAADLPHIPTMPISAQDAAVLLAKLGGRTVPREWQGALPFTYHLGPGKATVHMKLVMDYRERPIYDVIAKLQGAEANQWILFGNHHDAWVFGAADPGSGTASMLEAARALGELARSGWKPRRTIVFCSWDGEEPGLLGSTEWVEQYRARLQGHALVYVNTDVGVTGPNFGASASPSLGELVRDAARQVSDPATGMSVYQAWQEHAASGRKEISGTARLAPEAKNANEAPVGNLGSGSDYSAFLDFAGIPSMDLGFTGDYGVYHSLYDDFLWMQRFGDPQFAYHAALARILGILALRLDAADILPFDYSAYAEEIARAVKQVNARIPGNSDAEASLKPVADASAELVNAASRASSALGSLANVKLDSAQEEQLNRGLAAVEQDFLNPEGLAGRPWYKHTIFAPGSYAGYAAEVLPGVAEALDSGDSSTLHQEAQALAAALRRASVRLGEIERMARQMTAASPPMQP